MASPDTLYGIQDLRPLPPPADLGSAPWLAAIALMILLLSGWWLWSKLQSPRARAARTLRQMQRRANPTHRSAEHARQLASVLANGIGIHHLGKRTPIPASLHQQHARWQRFTSQLAQARYADPDSTPTTRNLPELAREARYWLRQWPDRSDTQ